jgi:hypothetical protein
VIDSSQFTHQAENTKVEQKWIDTATIMESIIAKELDTTAPNIKIIKENTEFLTQMGIINGAHQLELIDLSHAAHHKLNAILHENRKFHREMKAIYQENKNIQDQKEKEAKLREEKLNSFRGMEAGFNVIGQLGIATGNETIAKIGSVGAAGVSIATNAAMLSGAIPGVALSGWGLMIPYAGIALAGLSIAMTLFGKKKKKDDPMMKALQALADQEAAVTDLSFDCKSTFHGGRQATKLN